jgi:hypothetical protein
MNLFKLFLSKIIFHTIQLATIIIVLPLLLLHKTDNSDV